MISDKYQAALRELRAMGHEVPPGTWQRLRLIIRRFEALAEPIAGLETMTINEPRPIEEGSDAAA